MNYEISNLKNEIAASQEVISKHLTALHRQLHPFQKHTEGPVFTATAKIHDHLAIVEKQIKHEIPCLIAELERLLTKG